MFNVLQNVFFVIFGWIFVRFSNVSFTLFFDEILFDLLILEIANLQLEFRFDSSCFEVT